MSEFREDKDGRLQFKPPTDAQWTDAVECYLRNKVQTDAFNEPDSSEQELSEQLQGTLDLLGGGE